MVQIEIPILNVYKSCGPDAVHLWLVIEVAESITRPIALLNKTMKLDEIPRDWEKAYVSLIYKRGAKSKAENYRPSFAR